MKKTQKRTKDLAALKKDPTWNKFLAMQDPAKFKVETGIPIEIIRGFGCHLKWPDLFRAMENLKVGDSISYNTKDLRKAVIGCRTTLEKRGTYRFVTTQLDPKTSRTWRIEVTGNGKANRLNGQNVHKRAKVTA